MPREPNSLKDVTQDPGYAPRPTATLRGPRRGNGIARGDCGVPLKLGSRPTPPGLTMTKPNTIALNRRAKQGVRPGCPARQGKRPPIFGSASVKQQSAMTQKWPNFVSLPLVLNRQSSKGTMTQMWPTFVSSSLVQER